MFITSSFFCEPFEEMAFNLQSFVGESRMEEFNSLKKAELLQVAQHFKLTVNTSMGDCIKPFGRRRTPSRRGTGEC